ncbi:MAG: tryptophan synthase subunit alpha [Candidatus Sumerlaeaceae bacterium]|jgi:tryptophan synthase alpha chain
MADANRIDTIFVRLRERNEAALVPYLTAGFPQLTWTLPLLKMLAENGADIIELGVPFSDPIADGPTIQAACKVALEQGASLRSVLDVVAEFRREFETPIVLFGAFNPFFHYGLEQFAADAAQVGADAVLIPDVPVEETDSVRPALSARGLHLIELVAPTTPFERKKVIVERASGFLYYISVKGVTGARADTRFAIEGPLSELRLLTNLPVVVGFGIATAFQAQEVARLADGAVVGSALIERIRAASDLEDAIRDVGAWLHELAEAVKTARQTNEHKG